MNRLKRVMLGLTVLALCICVFAGSDPDLKDIATTDDSSANTPLDDQSSGEVTNSSADSSNDVQTTSRHSEITAAQTTATQAVQTKPGEQPLVSITLDKHTLFVQRDGYIVLKDENDLEAESVTVTPDGGGKPVTVRCKNNQISFEQDGKQITSFEYKGKTLSIKDASVYYGTQKLQYADLSFNRYDLTNEYAVVLSSSGQYTLRNTGGEILDSAIVTDDEGRMLTLLVSEDGTELIVRDDKGTRLDSFTLGGKKIELEEEMTVIDGKPMQRARSADIVTSISTSAAETNTPQQTSTTGEAGQTTTASAASQQVTAATKPTTATTAATNRQTAATAKTTTKAATTTKTAATTKTTTSGNISHPTLAPLKVASHYTKIEDKTAEFLALLNPVRASSGLKPLSANATISQAARIRAEEYAAYPELKHKRPSERGGDKYHTVFKDVVFDGRTGIPTYVTYTKAWEAGENLQNGYGTGSPDTTKQAFDKWMASSTHKAHMFKSAYKYTAVYKVTQQETIQGVSMTRYYWVQLFYSDLGSWAIR